MAATIRFSICIEFGKTWRVHCQHLTAPYIGDGADFFFPSLVAVRYRISRVSSTGSVFAERERSDRGGQTGIPDLERSILGF